MRETIGPLLAAGNVAEVFEWDTRVVKLYRSPARKPTAFREAAIHAAVEAMALPVPAVWGVLEVGGRWGIVFDRVKERSFAERMREDPSVIPEGLQALARLHARIHSQPARQLGSLKSRLATNIADTGLLEEPLKQILLGRLAGMPDGDRLCHGDFHPVNVLGQNSQPIVIDWPDACCGRPRGRCLPLLSIIKAPCRGHRRALSRCILQYQQYAAREHTRLAALRRGGEAGGGRSR
jgi:tRNA A-37 threonylcarbamoyl transferase component Bud32